MATAMQSSETRAVETQIRNIQTSTGKSVEQWARLVKAQKFEKHGEMVKWLKEEHGMGHGNANLIAMTARGEFGAEAPAGDDLLVAQYAGAKAGLKPMYDDLMKKIGKFGGDVEVSPKKAYVSLRRKKQFALIQPSTATRLDVGINLKGMPPAGRLEASGSFNAMVSHRVRVENAKDINAELVNWLKAAYDQAG
jgi:hypothetical protein